MLMVIISAIALHAQNSPQEELVEEEIPRIDIFPLTLVLEGAKYPGVWQPDWPLELPPDAFKVLSGELTKISVSGEGYTFKLSYSPAGLVEEFPFMLNGRMAQIGLAYNRAAEIRKLTVTFPGDDPWEMEFLEHRDAFPVLVRGFHSNFWYFVYFFRGGDEIRETWYDAEGNFLGAYFFSLTEIGETKRVRELKDYRILGRNTEFYYDSRGLMTEASGLGGLYKVLYFREDLPRYWERWPAMDESWDSSPEEFQSFWNSGRFSLQWDKRDLLLRIAGGQDLADFRYEYTLDASGNWIERREVRMLRRLGLLVPSRGITIKRVLEYKK